MQYRLINIDVLETEIKKNDISNGYIFCGLDEELIKISVDSIIKKVVEKDFLDLNLIKLDGLTTTFEEIENACETMPFFGEKKVVLVYRANFLKEKPDKDGVKTYSEISKYIKDLPSHTVLIMYYLFNDKRDTPKKNKKLTTLDKYVKVVHCDKLKKDRYYKKVDDLFKEKGRTIGKIQLRYFADKVQNNFDIIKREVDKLDCYAYGREITKEDIDKLIQNKSMRSKLFAEKYAKICKKDTKCRHYYDIMVLNKIYGGIGHEKTNDIIDFVADFAFIPFRTGLGCGSCRQAAFHGCPHIPLGLHPNRTGLF